MAAAPSAATAAGGAAISGSGFHRGSCLDSTKWRTGTAGFPSGAKASIPAAATALDAAAEIAHLAGAPAFFLGGAADHANLSQRAFLRRTANITVFEVAVTFALRAFLSGAAVPATAAASIIAALHAAAERNALAFALGVAGGIGGAASAIKAVSAAV